MTTDLTNLSAAQFEAELDRRLQRQDAAWKAVQRAFGPHLEALTPQTQVPTVPLAQIAENSDRLWAEMEASEQAAEEAWQELYRRRDRRLQRR